MTNINLLPWRELKREEEKKKFNILLLGAVICAAFIVFLLYYYSDDLVDDQMRRNQRLKDEISQFDTQIAEIKKLKEIRGSLVSRMRIIQGLQARRTLTVHLFDELVKVLPDGVYLTDFKREKDRITLTGYSESNTNVSILMQNIQQNPWIEDPVLTEIKKDKDASSAVNNEFSLSFTMRSKTSPALIL